MGLLFGQNRNLRKFKKNWQRNKMNKMIRNFCNFAREKKAERTFFMPFSYKYRMCRKIIISKYSYENERKIFDPLKWK